LPTAAAQADQEISAVPTIRYANPNLSIAPGEAVTFRNNDFANHDVTARTRGYDGRPLFASATIGGGQSAPVVGVQSLGPGSYAFFCTIHPNSMTGTLAVRGDGAPPPADGAPPPDTRAPRGRVRILDRALEAVERRGRVRVRVQSDEPGAARLVLRAGRRTLARRTVTLARAGSRDLRLRVPDELPRRRLSLTLELRDGAGNLRTLRTTRSLSA
jgi:plastocyanin